MLSSDEWLAMTATGEEMCVADLMEASEDDWRIVDGVDLTKDGTDLTCAIFNKVCPMMQDWMNRVGLVRSQLDPGDEKQMASLVELVKQYESEWFAKVAYVGDECYFVSEKDLLYVCLDDYDSFYTNNT